MALLTSSLGFAFRAAAILFLLLCAAARPAAAQAFDPGKVGRPSSDAPAVLYLPSGAAPAGAVIVLHGCDGVGWHDRQWAERLAEWGYAALLIDSFRPRGFTEVCNRGGLVPPQAQARNAFDGAAYLRASPVVRAQRVGVIGFSHGGSAVLKAVLAGIVRRPNEPPFDAAVAYYPGCDPRDPPGAPLDSDTLILIGDADDWASAARCTRWRELAQTNGHVLQIKIYPGARHAFDAATAPHYFAGHYIGQDPAAMTDALAETRKFFDERLRPGSR